MITIPSIRLCWGKSHLLHWCALFLSCILFACSESPQTQESSETVVEEGPEWKELLGARWRLAEIRYEEGEAAPVEGEGYWIEFEHDRASAGTMREHVYRGEAGAKTFAGQFLTGGTEVLFLGDVHLTGMTGAEASDLDKEFLDLVDRTTSCKVDGEEAMLFAPSLKKSAKFVR